MIRTQEFVTGYPERCSNKDTSAALEYSSFSASEPSRRSIFPSRYLNSLPSASLVSIMMDNVIAPSTTVEESVSSDSVHGDGHSLFPQPLKPSLRSSTSSTDSVPSLAPSISDTSLPAPSVRFDPRVWIREFPCEKDVSQAWYTEQEQQTFRSEAMQLILRYDTILLPTGTGRIVPQQKLLFSHRALAADSLVQDEVRERKDDYTKPAISIPRFYKRDHLIGKVLVVDPHDICLKLFERGFESLFPQATIVTASTADETVELLDQHNFDVVVVEERLQVFHRQNAQSQQASGLALVRNCLRPRLPRALLVGVSTPRKNSEWKTEVDLCWTKPPPRMDANLRDQLVEALSRKRS